MILAPPGTYSVAGELTEQTTMLIDLAKDIQTSGTLYSSIQNLRGQLTATKDGGGQSAADVRTAVDAVQQKAAALADRLTQQLPGAFYEWPVRLTAQLNYLATEVQSSDRKPTDQAREAHAALKAELRQVQSDYRQVVLQDVTHLNELLRARGLPPVVAITGGS
jgi:hypothetical protein